MEEFRKSEGLSLEELGEHTVELLPDREEMLFGGGGANVNIGAAAVAVQGAQAGFGQANQGVFDFGGGNNNA
jgi:hypothetical protein